MTPTQIIALAADLAQEKATADRFTTLLEAWQTPAQRDLVDEKEGATILGVTPRTLQVWRSTGRYAIAFLMVGRLVKFRRRALENGIKSHTRVSGAMK